MNPMTQTMKTPKMSTTKLSTNPDIDFARLLDMSNQTLDTEMVPPIDQDQLDTASGMRDIGSLAAALSGAVRGAGSVGGKLPDDFGFDQIARDMGNSRSVDLQNRMALRKQQENDMLEAIKNTGIAKKAQYLAELKSKPLSQYDRAYANKKLKDLNLEGVGEFPAETTYGDLWDTTIGNALGFGAGQGEGMTEWQRIQAGLQEFSAKNAAEDRAIQRKIQSMGAEAKINEESVLNSPVSRYVMKIIDKAMRASGIDPKDIPDSITKGEAQQEPYKSILGGAFMSEKDKANKADKDNKAKEKEEKEGLLTPTQLQTQRRALAGDLRKEKIPEAVDLVEKIEKILERNPKDIPGVGSTGALKGPASLLLSKDGQELRGLMTKQLNTLLNSRAGLAVTTGEFDRVAAELASNWWQSDENFVKQFNLMKAALGQVIINTWGGYGDQVKNAYMTQSIDTEGNKTVAGRNFGKWAAEVEDYVPGQKKSVPKTGTQSAPPKTGTEVPGNENIPKDALDKATDAYNNLGAIPYTPKPETKLDAKDQKLYDWAQKNPNDPRAQKVMKVIQNKIGTK